jgi:hypothetical protein
MTDDTSGVASNARAIMLMNRKMQPLWEKRDRQFASILPEKLEAIATSEIIELYDCWLLKGTCSSEALVRQYGPDVGRLPEQVRRNLSTKMRHFSVLI